MTEKVHCVRPGDDLATLVDLMEEIRVRHIPVVNEDRNVVGLVSQRDLIREVLHGRNLPFSETREMLTRRRVRSIMTKDLETVEPDARIEDAGQLMLDNKLGCLPVVEGERLVGILTEADFVKFTVARARRSPPAKR
jgi:CBS domain-containing membrane protein